MSAAQNYETTLTDEQLFDAIREQVNRSRNSPQGHDRALTRRLAAEMKRRGWRDDSPHAKIYETDKTKPKRQGQ